MCCIKSTLNATHIGNNANLALVDKFCYLGDMLNANKDANAVVETRIRIGWNTFRQLVPLLTNKDISLIVRGSSPRKKAAKRT